MNEGEPIGKWFAFIYSGNKNNQYTGRDMRRFLSDNIEDGGLTVACQMDCLRTELGVANNVFREYDNLTKDVDNIPANDFINGPLHEIYKNENFPHTRTRYGSFRTNEKKPKRLGANVQCICFKSYL